MSKLLLTVTLALSLFGAAGCAVYARPLPPPVPRRIVATVHVPRPAVVVRVHRPRICHHTECRPICNPFGCVEECHRVAHPCP